MSYKLIASILPLVWGAISPTVKDALKSLIADLEVKAKETANPIDDIAVAILKDILGID